jgi:tetratricopeptide (TPR) repeat protein
MALRTALGVLGFVIILSAPALADSKSEAKERVARAMKLFEENKFAEARAELLNAFALDPRPELLYALGQVHVKLGECTQAITFYQRFLDTRPAADVAALAKEAIDACKNNRIEPAPEPAPEPVPEPAPVVPEPTPVPEPPKPRPPEQVVVTSEVAIYRDPLGLGLVGGGVLAGVVGLVMYRSATGARDDADAATTYQQFEDLMDRASQRRAYAVAFGAGAATLIGAGVARLVLRDRTRQEIRMAPAAGGGVVSWSTRF